MLENTTVRAEVASQRQELLRLLDEWLRIPGVSAQPEHAVDVGRSANWLAGAFRHFGLEDVEVWETPGLPSVFAERRSEDAGAPTVLVYAHHDVQPAHRPETWDTPPFEPTLDGDILRARGASDDKGQVLLHLLGLQAHLRASGRSSPAVNLKFLIEGEEESGSPHLEALLHERRSRLECDMIVVTDSGILGVDSPSTVTSMRGVIAGELRLDAAARDLHSGLFGGAVPNPATALARLVTALHDPHDRVAVPGFYDDVREPTDLERDRLRRVPFSEQAFLRAAGSRAVHGEHGWSTLERTGLRPTAEVNALSAGYQGPGLHTVIPSGASAKLSFRLVPDQEPSVVCEAVERFIAAHTPPGVSASMTWEGPGVRPYHVEAGTPAYLAVTAALSDAFDGRPVLATREGGSGPEATLAYVIDRPLVFLGVGLPDDRIHAANEKVSISMLLKGAEAVAHLWRLLADGGTEALRRS